MAFPKIEETRNLNDSELADQILAVKRRLFELRLQKATRQLEKPHEFKHARHRLSQLMTVEGERKRAAEEASVKTDSDVALESAANPSDPAKSTDTKSAAQEE